MEQANWRINIPNNKQFRTESTRPAYEEEPYPSRPLQPSAQASTEHLKFFSKSIIKPSKVCFGLQFFTTNKLSFVKLVKVLKFSSRGGQYRDDSLGLCIDVPEGAVPENSLLVLEVGMCLYGPFKFPDGSTPIAPILMLCPQNDIKLNKSFRVTLPHILKDGDHVEAKCQVIKADHTSLMFGADCVFDNIIGDSDLSASSKDDKGYLTFSLSHFCFVTVRATWKLEDAEECGYCICPLFPSPRERISFSPNDFTYYYLCVTYFIGPCLKAIEEQFSGHEYELRRSRIRKFTFKGNQKSIYAELLPVRERGWTLSLDSDNEVGIQEISAESVNLWNKGEEELRQMMTNLSYPPSFQISVILEQGAANSKAKIKFTTHDQEDTFHMNLPLNYSLIASLMGLRSVATPMPADRELFGRKRLRSNEIISGESELEQEDLGYLALHFDSVEFYLDAMQLTADEKADVRRAVLEHGNRIGMERCLECWREHDKSAATFNALIKMLTKLKKEAIAEKVCEYLATKQRELTDMQ